jgi:hypothetical protein
MRKFSHANKVFHIKKFNHHQLEEKKPKKVTTLFPIHNYVYLVERNGKLMGK